VDLFGEFRCGGDDAAQTRDPPMSKDREVGDLPVVELTRPADRGMQRRGVCGFDRGHGLRAKAPSVATPTALCSALGAQP
jgi:hypothetical protein